MARLNRPQPQGEIFKAIGAEWTLYALGQDRYKLCSNVPIEGNANYNLVIQRGRISRIMDQYRLKSSRPFLYEDVEKAFGTAESFAIDDPYGDIAIASGKPLTVEQQWQRKLIYMRETYLTRLFTDFPYDMERAIKALYPPVFGEDPTPKVIEEAREFIYRGDKPNEEALLGVLRDYYEGRYKPKSIETLILNLDIICGVL